MPILKYTQYIKFLHSFLLKTLKYLQKYYKCHYKFYQLQALGVVVIFRYCDWVGEKNLRTLQSMSIDGCNNLTGFVIPRSGDFFYTRHLLHHHQMFSDGFHKIPLCLNGMFEDKDLQIEACG